MVEIKNLSISYGNSSKVLKNISLNVKKGDVYYLPGKAAAENLQL